MRTLVAFLSLLALLCPALAQTPPSPSELSAYAGLHEAAAKGDVAAIETLAKSGAALEALDGNRRTPLIVAAHQRQHAAARTLLRLGAS